MKTNSRATSTASIAVNSWRSLGMLAFVLFFVLTQSGLAGAQDALITPPASILNVAAALTAMGRNDVAERLIRDYERGKVVATDLGADNAATGPKAILRVADRISNGIFGVRSARPRHNIMEINQNNLEGQAGNLQSARNPVNGGTLGIALTVIHEYEHMAQTNPRQVPEYEDQAWRTTIAENQRWMNNVMGQIREAERNLPDGPEKSSQLRHLSETLNELKQIHDVTVNDAKAEMNANHVSANTNWTTLDGRSVTNINEVITSASPVVNAVTRQYLVTGAEKRRLDQLDREREKNNAATSPPTTPPDVKDKERDKDKPDTKETKDSKDKTASDKPLADNNSQDKSPDSKKAPIDKNGADKDAKEAADKALADKAAIEKAEKEQQTKEMNLREKRQAQEKSRKEREAAEKAEKDRVAKDLAAKEKNEADKAAARATAQQAAADKASAPKLPPGTHEEVSGWAKDSKGSTKLTYIKDAAGNVVGGYKTHYDPSGKETGREDINASTASSSGFDGTYAGRFGGQAGGSMRMVIKGNSVSGSVSGSSQGDGVNASISGSVNASGRIQATISGVLRGRLSEESKMEDWPFSGTMSGSVSGKTASGSWNAAGFGQKNSGSWSVSR